MNGTRKTEIYCHGCERYFSVELDYDLNGNHEIKCPNCGHIHYRVIENGVVTGERYRSSMGQSYTYPVTSYTSTYSTSYQYYSSTTTSTITYCWTT
jgi:DNA-directed RNA polymerase subunit RPC12/RpoP